MERNYPPSFNKFWDSLQRNSKASKTKDGTKFNFRIERNYILMIAQDQYGNSDWNSTFLNDKEEFYCDMLDVYMFPRVKEYS